MRVQPASSCRPPLPPGCNRVACARLAQANHGKIVIQPKRKQPATKPSGVQKPAKRKAKPTAYVLPGRERDRLKQVCTATFGFCCRPASEANAPPRVAKLNPGKKSSKFYGVGWCKRVEKWHAAIRHNGKVVNLGHNFDTEIAAAKAVDVWLRANGRAADANFDESGEFVPRVPKKSSKFRGVSWKNNQWKAEIKVAGKLEHLGYFDDEEAAARAFDSRAGPLGRPTNFDVDGVEIDYSA